jgi:ABC-type bacteriocin/lantibiotic exporter with double-glycine peptidase domain
MLNVKPFKSSPAHCGPGVMKMVLGYYGIDKTEKELAKEMKWNPADGVTTNNMVKAAKKYGLEAFIKDNSVIKDIRHYVLEKKIPVIVEWFLEDEAHYCVVVDIDKKNIYLMDPYKEYKPAVRKMPLFGDSGFDRIWFSFEGECMKSINDLFLRRMIVIYK